MNGCFQVLRRGAEFFRRYAEKIQSPAFSLLVYLAGKHKKLFERSFRDVFGLPTPVSSKAALNARSGPCSSSAVCLHPLNTAQFDFKTAGKGS